jgi:hypothetical protein
VSGGPRAECAATCDGLDVCFHPSEIRIQLPSEYKDNAKLPKLELWWQMKMQGAMEAHHTYGI